MTILFIGDIVGRAGRAVVKKILPSLRKKKNIDFVIANGENVAGGSGMTFETYRELTEAGIDYFTSGNHIFKKSDFIPYLDDKSIKVLRPVNYSGNVPGRGIVTLHLKPYTLNLVNLQGLVFMDEYLDNPFKKIDAMLAKNDKSTITIIDFHGEATSEKVTFGHYLDGRVAAVLGTHTHIQTNDAKILPKGTAYVTDTGMCGALYSSLGDELSDSTNHFLTGLPFKINPAKEKPHIFNAALLDINEKTSKSKSIELVNIID
ncbi:MAG: TIGR00282 family metallophosphoesterase [Patescibacteria group bacterium]|nr:TIGR00282 family metallophosphoesterase [Patescibacteria group bacterium]